MCIAATSLKASLDRAVHLPHYAVSNDAALRDCYRATSAAGDSWAALLLTRDKVQVPSMKEEEFWGHFWLFAYSLHPAAVVDGGTSSWCSAVAPYLHVTSWNSSKFPFAVMLGRTVAAERAKRRSWMKLVLAARCCSPLPVPGEGQEEGDRLCLLCMCLGRRWRLLCQLKAAPGSWELGFPGLLKGFEESSHLDILMAKLYPWVPCPVLS